MSRTHISAAWPPGPPEVPPPFRPGTPWQPPQPAPSPPILPGWEERRLAPSDRDIVDRLLDERIVHAGGRVDTTLANRTTAQLLLLGRHDPRPVELHLSCRDSELDASLALAGTLSVLAAPVHVVVHGTLRGPAIAVLCAAQDRAAHRGATLVLSLPRAEAAGTAAQLAVEADQHERQVDRVCELVAGTTGRDADAVRADLRAGRVLSAEDAFAHGLLTRLL